MQHAISIDSWLDRAVLDTGRVSRTLALADPGSTVYATLPIAILGKKHLSYDHNRRVMPSRRNVLRGTGPVLVGSVAGCLTSQTTTGIVARKQIEASVPRTVGRPVTASLAVLTFESDGTVTGEYADIVSDVINDASISVSDAVHDRLADRFADVRYYANIVPDNGSKPANGHVSRDDFNTLTVGGTATVDSVMKTVGTESSSSHLEIHDTTPRETPPTEIRVSQYDWDERADEIRGGE